VCVAVPLLVLHLFSGESCRSSRTHRGLDHKSRLATNSGIGNGAGGIQVQRLLTSKLPENLWFQHSPTAPSSLPNRDPKERTHPNASILTVRKPLHEPFSISTWSDDSPTLARRRLSTSGFSLYLRSIPLLASGFRSLALNIFGAACRGKW
jgi:hypothetical protein